MTTRGRDLLTPSSASRASVLLNEVAHPVDEEVGPRVRGQTLANCAEPVPASAELVELRRAVGSSPVGMQALHYAHEDVVLGDRGEQWRRISGDRCPWVSPP